MTRYTIINFGIMAAALVAAACSDDTGGDATASGPGSTSSASASSGAGGDPGDKDPSEITSADDCFYEGEGGSNAFRCSAATIQLAEPVPVDALTFVVETSEGDVFDVSNPDLPVGVVVAVDEGGGDGGAGGGGGSGAVATALVVYVDSPPPHYNPAWIDVQVRVDGELVGAERFEDLKFACVASSQDDWCWESEPVTLPIDATE